MTLTKIAARIVGERAVALAREEIFVLGLFSSMIAGKLVLLIHQCSYPISFLKVKCFNVYIRVCLPLD
jgi:hypothetical protein